MGMSSDKRMVAGTATANPVFWPAVRSKNVVAVTATPKTPIPLGARLIFALGAALVVRSLSSRERVNCELSSSGRPISNAQAGLTAPMT
jgi:hypothetical protein